MSSSLYDTFGNETKYELSGGTLISFLQDATIKFPLPEASAEFLEKLGDPQAATFDPAKTDMIKSKLIKLGFSAANATALTPVLMQVSKAQGIDPLDFFEINQNALNLTLDTYKAINVLRPVGSRVTILAPTVNATSKAGSLIQP
jgi:hypothetical protein